MKGFRRHDPQPNSELRRFEICGETGSGSSQKAELRNDGEGRVGRIKTRRALTRQAISPAAPLGMRVSRQPAN